MKKKPGYKGNAPEELYVVSTGEEFRTYVYIKQALRRLDSQIAKGKSTQMHTYIRQDAHETKGVW